MRALIVVALAACQPMYGSAAGPLRDPPKRPAPADPGPRYIEACTVDFTRDARTAHPAPRVAEQAVARVADNDAWFAGYRAAALAAIRH